MGLKPFYEVIIRGMENYSESPSSLIVANHKRDLDSILVATVFFYSEGFFSPGHPISFMAAENLFQPGFLANWIRRPEVLKKIIRPLSIGTVLKTLNAYPIGKLNFRSVPLYDALGIIKEKNGDRKLEDIIQEEKLNKILNGPLNLEENPTISDFFESEGYPRKRINSSVFKKKYRKVVKENKLGSVKGQLERFIQLMDQGEILYITPEGKLSSDGLLGPLKDSLHILLEEPEEEVTVVPTNITYDFMTSGKPTININIGEEMNDLDNLERKERSKIIREAILSLTTVTFSQLGSRQLVGALESDRTELKREEIYRGTRECWESIAKNDLSMDKHLEEKYSFDHRFDNFIDFCIERGILIEQSKERFYIDPELGFREEEVNRGYRKNPVEYTANELQALETIDLVSLPR